jgi:Cu/Zn superoxide dismutase
VARFRKTAIAAAAVSALVLAPSAAYAHEDHHGVSANSARGMKWANYSGAVTDFTTTSPDVFKGARASAIMMGLDGRSFFRLRVSGIHAKDGTFGVHLHQGKCDAKDPAAAQGHYNVNWDPIQGLLGPVNSKTEVWLDLDVDSRGNAQSTATVSFIPDGERSIVLHALPTLHEPDNNDHAAGWAGDRLACLPFSIKSYGG